MRTRYVALLAIVYGLLAGSVSAAESFYSQWRQMLERPADSSSSDSLQGLSERSVLDRVDLYVNRAEYVEDWQQFGVGDYWSSPAEFFISGRGDCEDFAIAKYFTLLKLGFAPDRLKLVFGLLEDGSRHMLLAYYESPGKPPLLLDNLTRSPTPADMRRDFTPVYSFDREHFWLMRGWQQNAVIKEHPNQLSWQRIHESWKSVLLASR